MNNEQKFLAALAGVINPGWDIHILSDRADAGALRAFDTYFYVVDVATGWFAAGGLGAMSASQARSMGRERTKAVFELEEGFRGVSEAAGLVITHCGESGPASSAADTQAAISLSFAAMTETKTFAAAVERNLKAGAPEIAGHWVYLAYKASQRVTLRPVWVTEGMFPGVPTGKFMEPHVLEAFVRTVIQGDTTSPTSSVGAMLRNDGGAIVAKRWRP
ncbi:hypothetical protein ACSFA0_22710 [Variovorax sp. LT1P1]|uniref:hypothetical protein n=1 Tax=Variovorax sp. LT1P1 TaxID=3443730 RepID=UPI003F48A306